ncbi:MAG TPA: hypothetical protein VM934_07695, partial [Pyrinomonadaceae bacterium]|nr:hypothetical protein [Pyrinomonadaceae bacterium]
DPDVQRKVARNIIDNGLSVRETERTIKRIISGVNVASAIKPTPVKDDANIKAAETKLRRRLGSKVQIQANPSGNGGKIEIEFYDINDLNRVYEIIIGGEEIG